MSATFLGLRLGLGLGSVRLSVTLTYREHIYIKVSKKNVADMKF